MADLSAVSVTITYYCFACGTAPSAIVFTRGEWTSLILGVSPRPTGPLESLTESQIEEIVSFLRRRQPCPCELESADG